MSGTTLWPASVLVPFQREDITPPNHTAFFLLQRRAAAPVVQRHLSFVEPPVWIPSEGGDVQVPNHAIFFALRASGSTAALTGQSATFSAGTVSPGVSVALTGQTASFTAGTVTPALSKALTGNTGTFTSGTLGVSQSVALTGLTGLFTPGTLSTSNDVTAALTGQSATFTAGTLGANLSVALTGSSATFTPGTLGVTHSQALTGATITSATGQITPSTSVALTGLSATFTAGIASVSSPNVTVALTGLQGTFSPGLLKPSTTVALSGQSGSFAPGIITPVSGVIVALTGITAVFTPGNLSLLELVIPNVQGIPLGTAALLLNNSSFQVGALTYQTSTTIALGSVILQVPVAGTLAFENTPVNLRISSGFLSPTNNPVGQIKLPNLPNKILPPDNALVDERGVIATNWWRFLLNVSNQALGTNQTTQATVTAGASPFVFTTPAQGTLLVSGGPVTLIEYSKDALTWYPTGVTQGQIQMVPNDHVRITYMNAPTLTFFPR